MSALISEDYRQQNQQLHEDAEKVYGEKGQNYAVNVWAVCQTLATKDVLDYGCGKRTLEKALGFPIQNYDPCIPGLDKAPVPADILVCTDVLEHIEPDCLDAVLDDIRRLTKQAAFLTIDTRPARKFLPDGRNAHLIQEQAPWWFPKLYQRFPMVQIQNILLRGTKSLGFIALCK